MLIKRRVGEAEMMNRCDSRHGERGIVLILCIGFLAILSILGATVLNLTNKSLSQSGRDQVTKNVFYTVDRAVEYALSPNVYTNLIDEGDQVDLTLAPHKDLIVSPGTDLIRGMVTFEGSGGAPAKSAKYDKTASAAKVYRYFHITAEAQSTNPRVTASSFVDEQYVQVFPAVTNVPVEYVTGDVDAPGTGGN
jgi:hypothetical protein